VHVLKLAAGRDANRDAVVTPDWNDRVEDVGEQTRAIFRRAAIFVGALVCAVLQELVDQISVSSVDLDSVEAGRLRPFGGLPVAGAVPPVRST
jgi:hypothetical protein